MSRVSYNEDDTWAAIRWGGRRKQALGSKRGQTALRELRDALVAMPDKRLIADEFARPDGAVCALGAYAHYKGVEPPLGEIDAETWAVEHLGLTFTLAWEVMSQNDEGGNPYWGRAREWSPEERHQHVLSWVQTQIKDE